MSNHRMDTTTACWSALALLAAVLGASAQAAGGDSLAGTAHGSFSQVGETLEVVDGFAYETVGHFGEPVISVVLVPAPLDRDALAAVIDFGVELDRQFAASGLFGRAVLDIDPATGRWLGSSYSLSGGYGCSYCSVSAQQRLEVGNGRVRGKLRLRPEDGSEGDGPDVRLTLDLPIARVTGTEVVVESSRKKTAFYGRRELLAEHFEFSGGRIKGDRAELLVETRDEGEIQRGSIFFQRVDAGWRWIGQRMEPVYDDE